MSDDRDLRALMDIPDPFAAEATPRAKRAQPPAPPTRSPTRADVRRRRTRAALGVILFQVGWVAIVEHRRDLAAVPGWLLALGLVIPLAAATLAFGAVVGRGRGHLGLPASSLVALSLAPPLLFATATLLSFPADVDTGRFWDLAVRCMAVTSVLTAVALAAGAYVLRHAFAAASVGRTAALGVACGALSAATMSLACWHSGAIHVVVGHGAMMVVGGLVGALLGRRVTRA